MASVGPADSPVPEYLGQEPPYLDLDRLEAGARTRLPAPVYDYYAGGAEAETTLAEATGAWRGWRLRPRVLRGVSEVRLSTELLGSPVGTPIGVAPWAAQALAHPDGELGTARGAAAAGALMTVSTSATHTLEESAAGGETFAMTSRCRPGYGWPTTRRWTAISPRRRHRRGPSTTSRASASCRGCPSS
jgi:4-hydroxymandelate oxidase